MTAGLMLRTMCTPALAMLLASCQEARPPGDLDRDARSFLLVLARGQPDSARSPIEPAGAPGFVGRRLDAARRFLAPLEMDSAKLVGWDVAEMQNQSWGRLTYEVRSGKAWARIAVTVTRGDSASKVDSLSWELARVPLAQTNSFSFLGREPGNYAYLVLAAAAATFSIGSAVLAAFRRMGVLWVLFCLVGAPTASINWTTGAQSFRLFQAQLLSAGLWRPGSVGPWILAFSLPIGAIATLLRWHRKASIASPPPAAHLSAQAVDEWRTTR